MSISIRDEETDRKAAEIAAAMGGSKAAVARQAVDELHERLQFDGRLPLTAKVWLRPLARRRRP